MRDISILKMVVVIVGLVEIISMVGIILLVMENRTIPGTLETIAVAGLTGLLGLLAPSREAAA